MVFGRKSIASEKTQHLRMICVQVNDEGLIVQSPLGYEGRKDNFGQRIQACRPPCNDSKVVRKVRAKAARYHGAEIGICGDRHLTTLKKGGEYFLGLFGAGSQD
jgi:hypothetical protein